MRTESFNHNRTLIVRLSDPFLKLIVSTLKQHPRLRATRLFQMLRDRGYQGMQHPSKRFGTLSGRDWRIPFSILYGDNDHAQTDFAASPRLGAVFQPTSALSLYFSYAKSFSPSYPGTVQVNNRPFLPESGRQFEGGAKFDLLNRRINGTLAVYRLLRKNVATANPVNPNFVQLTGEQGSQGIEVETALNLRPGWNLTAAYTYLDSKVTEDTEIPVGTRTLNVPRNRYNLWTRYELQRGRVRRLGRLLPCPLRQPSTGFPFRAIRTGRPKSTPRPGLSATFRSTSISTPARC